MISHATEQVEAQRRSDDHDTLRSFDRGWDDLPLEWFQGLAGSYNALTC